MQVCVVQAKPVSSNPTLLALMGGNSSSVLSSASVALTSLVVG